MKKFKVPSWEDLAKITHSWREENEIFEYLKTVPEHSRNFIALALSVAKWMPELRESSSRLSKYTTCGLCIHFNCTDSDGDLRHFGYGSCRNCPLYISGNGCTESDSTYDNWVLCEEIDDGEKEADAMYDALVALYTKAYNSYPVWPF